MKANNTGVSIILRAGIIIKVITVLAHKKIVIIKNVYHVPKLFCNNAYKF